jgi:hypothetical protein
MNPKRDSKVLMMIAIDIDWRFALAVGTIILARLLIK